MSRRCWGAFQLLITRGMHFLNDLYISAQTAQEESDFRSLIFMFSVFVPQKSVRARGLHFILLQIHSTVNHPESNPCCFVYRVVK